jgi:hypothetical protein
MIPTRRPSLFKEYCAENPEIIENNPDLLGNYVRGTELLGILTIK